METLGFYAKWVVGSWLKVESRTGAALMLFGLIIGPD